MQRTRSARSRRPLSVVVAVLMTATLTIGNVGPAAAQASGIQYTPQTVVVPAATVASSLRSVSGGGSVYTFSSHAGVLGELKAGSVMLLQGTTVRLVTSAAQQPSGFVVTTTPASITDLISNGTLSWDTPVNFANALGLEGSGVPTDGARQPALVARQHGSAAVRVARSLESQLGLAALNSSGVTLKGKASGYAFSLEFKQEGTAVSLTFTLGRSSPVDLSVSVTGTLQNFSTDGAIAVKHGSVASSKIAMNNLSGQFTLSYELKPLSSFGLGKNGGFVLKLPGELEVPFAIGGIPFFLGIKTAFFVTVGFSNKNQSISGSYTINYNGDAGFSTSASGVSTGTGAIQGIGKVLLDQANAIMSGPISLVLGAQVPQLELGLGIKGLNVAGFVDLVADTAIQVGGNGGGVGVSTGCDARVINVTSSAGAEANFFGFSASSSPVTLFSKNFQAAYPPGCGTVGI